MVTAKKATKKAKVAKKTKPTVPISFKLHRNKTPFFTFKITDQTIYWLVLLSLILALGIWVINIQINIANILEDVNRINAGL